MYWERQVGGNCRIHALNAFYGAPRITVEKFRDYVEKYDRRMAAIFNTAISAADFDLMGSDRNNIVSFVAKHESGTMTINYPPNTWAKVDVKAAADRAAFIWIYNESHIWAARAVGGQWTQLDSLSGASAINLDTLLSKKTLGIIAPIAPADLYRLEYTAIKRQLPALTLETAKVTIAEHIRFLDARDLILGDMETSIGVCVDVLEHAIRFDDDTRLEMIRQKIIRNYYAFLPQFTRGRYNDLGLKVSALPYVIYGVLYLYEKL